MVGTGSLPLPSLKEEKERKGEKEERTPPSTLIEKIPAKRRHL